MPNEQLDMQTIKTTLLGRKEWIQFHTWPQPGMDIQMKPIPDLILASSLDFTSLGYHSRHLVTVIIFIFGCSNVILQYFIL